MGPVDDSALGVPLIFTVEGDAVSHPQGCDSGAMSMLCAINKVCPERSLRMNL
jgi:hypothetical protein